MAERDPAFMTTITDRRCLVPPAFMTNIICQSYREERETERDRDPAWRREKQRETQRRSFSLPTPECAATSQAKTHRHVQPETTGHTIFGVGWAWRRGLVAGRRGLGSAVYCSVNLGLNLGFGLMDGYYLV
jgi:hypothetical protein